MENNWYSIITKRPQHLRYGLIFYPNASRWRLLFQLFFLLLCTICVPKEQFHRLKVLILLSLGNSVSYSNSIVAGGLVVQS